MNCECGDVFCIRGRKCGRFGNRNTEDEVQKITRKQQEYIQQLSIDLQHKTIKHRNLDISELLNRPIKYLDELTLSEATRIIDHWKYLKQLR